MTNKIKSILYIILFFFINLAFFLYAVFKNRNRLLNISDLIDTEFLIILFILLLCSLIPTTLVTSLKLNNKKLQISLKIIGLILFYFIFRAIMIFITTIY